MLAGKLCTRPTHLRRRNAPPRPTPHHAPQHLVHALTALALMGLASLWLLMNLSAQFAHARRDLREARAARAAAAEMAAAGGGFSDGGCAVYVSTNRGGSPKLSPSGRRVSAWRRRARVARAACRAFGGGRCWSSMMAHFQDEWHDAAFPLSLSSGDQGFTNASPKPHQKPQDLTTGDSDNRKSPAPRAPPAFALPESLLSPPAPAPAPHAPSPSRGAAAAQPARAASDILLDEQVAALEAEAAAALGQSAAAAAANAQLIAAGAADSAEAAAAGSNGRPQYSSTAQRYAAYRLRAAQGERQDGRLAGRGDSWPGGGGGAFGWTGLGTGKGWCGRSGASNESVWRPARWARREKAQWHDGSLLAVPWLPRPRSCQLQQDPRAQVVALGARGGRGGAVKRPAAAGKGASIKPERRAQRQIGGSSGTRVTPAALAAQQVCLRAGRLSVRRVPCFFKTALLLPRACGRAGCARSASAAAAPILLPRSRLALSSPIDCFARPSRACHRQCPRPHGAAGSKRASTFEHPCRAPHRRWRPADTGGLSRERRAAEEAARVPARSYEPSRSGPFGGFGCLGLGFARAAAPLSACQCVNTHVPYIGACRGRECKAAGRAGQWPGSERVQPCAVLCRGQRCA